MEIFFLEGVLFSILNQWMKYPINRSPLYASESFPLLKMAFCLVGDVKFCNQWPFPVLPQLPEMKSCYYRQLELIEDDEVLGCQSWSFLYRVVSIHTLSRTVIWSSRYHMPLQFYRENALVRTRNLFPERSLELILLY